MILVLASSLRTFYHHHSRKEVDPRQWEVGDYCVTRTAEYGWVRALITGLEEGQEYAETFLCDRGIQYRALRRILKPLAEQFSSQPQHSFRLLVMSPLSEEVRPAVMRRVQELIDKAEKVAVEVGKSSKYCEAVLSTTP